MDEFEQIIGGTRWTNAVSVEVEKQADLTASYWKQLKSHGLPDKDATYLTSGWMELCVYGPSDDDEDE